MSLGGRLSYSVHLCFVADVWQAAGKAARKLVLPNGRGRDLENTQPREKSYVTLEPHHSAVATDADCTLSDNISG